MTEPFNAHDADIRRIAMKLRKGTPHMHKGMSESVELLEQSLKEWQSNCPGAGWEHHNLRAVVTLAMTPAMAELMRLAAVGKAAEDGELSELKHVADRIYTSNPEYDKVIATYKAAAALEREP